MKMDTEKKLYKKTVRLNETELKKVDELCMNQEVNFSEYIRLLIEKDNGTVITRKTKSAYQQDKQLIEEIRRIGININQIASNINGFFYSAEDKAKLYCYLEDLKKLLKKKVN